MQTPGRNGKLLQTHVYVFALVQNNWEAVKALALDTSCAAQQQPTSPSHDAQSTAQVSCISLCICFPGACTAKGGSIVTRVCQRGHTGGPQGACLSVECQTFATHQHANVLASMLVPHVSLHMDWLLTRAGRSPETAQGQSDEVMVFSSKTSMVC